MLKVLLGPDARFLLLQGQLLRRLNAQGVPHLVKILASGECFYQGREWHALLLAPYAHRLAMQLGRKLLAQVCLLQRRKQTRLVFW